MPVLRSPAVYIPHPSFGRPIGLGRVYIFTSGVSVPSSVDSVSALDLVDIFYNDETGEQIEISQPLNTTKGGILYSDDPMIVRQYYTDAANYIFAVYDSSGALVYYDAMSGTFGGGSGGEAGAAIIISDWNQAVVAGFYQDENTASLNQPVPGRRFIGWAANSNESGDSISQYAIDVTQSSGAAYVRVRSLGVFGSWRQVWDSSSFTRQSGFLDATANAALLTGAGGLVGSAVEWTNSLNDIDLTAFYKLTGAASDFPAGATIIDSAVIHIKVDSASAYQLFFSAGSAQTFVRFKSGAWGNWRRIGQTPLSPKAGNYDITNSDFGAILRFSGGTVATLNIAGDIGYNGGLVQVINRNGGNLTITSAGITLTWLQGGSVAAGSRTLAPGSVATLLRVDATNYEISGFGIS